MSPSVLFAQGEEPPVYRARYTARGILADGLLRDWPYGEAVLMTPARHRLSGEFGEPSKVQAKVRFVWDDTFLYLGAKVTDDDVVVRRSGKHAGRDDFAELFVDPAGDGFSEADPGDFVLGFRPRKDDKNTVVWRRSRVGEEPVEAPQVFAASYSDEKGYIIEAAIRWDFLGIVPHDGEVVRLSPAVHTMDRETGAGRLMWFYREEGVPPARRLGKVILDGQGRGGREKK